MNILEKIELPVRDPGLDDVDSPPELVQTTGGYTSFDSLPRFEYVNAGSIAEAVSLLQVHGDHAALMAGGQDLLRRLRGRVHPAAPRVLINIKTVLPKLDDIRETDDGLVIGSLATLRSVEASPIVRRKYPVLAQAAYATGALQYRNMATLGGDLCQQVRCWYYMAGGNAYDCRRKGGSQCHALDGDNRYHAVFGGQTCVATCPSDIAPALTSLDAKICIAGRRGERKVAVKDFFTPLGNVLAPDEMVTAVHLPLAEPGSRGVFQKLTQGNIFDPALVTVAVVARLNDGLCRSPRITLGAVGFKPWRVAPAERKLAGQKLDAGSAARAAQAAVADARPLGCNEYKVDIARILVQRAILALASEDSKPV